MALRRNLAPNPACAVSATGWTGPDGGWTRNTMGPGMPRTFGFEGGGGGDVKCPRAAITGGQTYYWAVTVRALADLSSNMLVNYYATDHGTQFLGNSGPTVPLDLADGDIARFVLGPYTAPNGALSGYLKLNDLDGNCEVTAYQVESADTWDGTYFDGASPGASWDGTPGESTSTIRLITELVGTADSFGVFETPVGPVSRDTATLGETFTIAASATAADPVATLDWFLITSLEYREDRGRVRIEAFTFPPNVTRARVLRRAASSNTWTLLRGGEVDVRDDGHMSRPVDDYEYQLGVTNWYQVQGVDREARVLSSAIVRRDPPAYEPAWLKFAGNPRLNRGLEIMTWDDIERSSRTSLYDVQGRSDPVVVSDVHSSRSTTLTVLTRTPQDRDSLDAALRLGTPVWLQVPPTIPLPTMWVSVGNYRIRHLSRRSQRFAFDIAVTEVSPPPASAFVAAYFTYDSVLAQYATYDDLATATPTYLAMAAAD